MKAIKPFCPIDVFGIDEMCQDFQLEISAEGGIAGLDEEVDESGFEHARARGCKARQVGRRVLACSP